MKTRGSPAPPPPKTQEIRAKWRHPMSESAETTRISCVFGGESRLLYVNEGWPAEAGHPASVRYREASTSRMSAAVSLGVLPTLTPAASSASFLPWAVPAPAETMAPAWPMVLPSGAVKPAT